MAPSVSKDTDPKALEQLIEKLAAAKVAEALKHAREREATMQRHIDHLSQLLSGEINAQQERYGPFQISNEDLREQFTKMTIVSAR